MVPLALPLALPLLLALLPPSCALGSSSDEFFCGLKWNDAADHCRLHCPTGEDDECREALGPGYKCFYYTGCEPPPPEEEEETLTIENEDETEGQVESNNFCGRSWLHAMLGCGRPCPRGTECRFPGERCFAATNCHRPLEELVSELMTTLAGPDETMGDEDADIFTDTIFETIARSAEELGVALGGVDVGEQRLVGRRELSRRVRKRELRGGGGDGYLNFRLTNVTQRMLPSGSSAVDVSMVVTGDYRPPPYVDLDVIAQDSINRDGASVVKTLRQRGQRAGREFFDRVEGIEVVRLDAKTSRPTRSPARSPTWSPIGPPTGTPSAMPTYSPIDMPSTPPSRPLDQSIMTGSREDLQMGGLTTSSYGYVFNMRTKPDAGVVLITGMDFYTESTDVVNFELWTRPGSFEGHKGTYDGWDLVASGSVQGRGIGRYTTIPHETYTPVAVPGGGGDDGTRAFYLTLDTINLVYKLGEEFEGQAVNLESDSRPHAETDDLEIWEGEGVLFYPFPDPADTMFYRYPRRYLGAIYYDRLPCRPYSLYGPVNELPCPRVPTGNPTVPPPTRNPTLPPTPPPSGSPVSEPTRMPTWTPTRRPVEGQTPAPVPPTRFPTQSPTESREPTDAPTTDAPTFAPVVPMRAYVVVRLHDTPARRMDVREEEKFLDIVATFLDRRAGNSMTIQGVDLWHQELILPPATDDDDAEGEEEGEEEESAPQVVAGRASRKMKRGNKDRPGRGDRDRRDDRDEGLPSVVCTELTLIVRVTFSNLPFETIGQMAVATMGRYESELLGMMWEQMAFYSFFKTVDGVEGRVIRELTYAPTLTPTTEEYRIAKLEELMARMAMKDAAPAEAERSAIGIFVGLSIGLLWCILTVASAMYLMKARGEMEERRDMEELLRAEKADPLGEVDGEGDDAVSAKSGKSGKSGRSRKSGKGEKGNDPEKSAAGVDGSGDSDTVEEGLASLGASDIGDPDDFDDLDDEDPFDHTKNTRLTGSSRDVLARSVMQRDDGPPLEVKVGPEEPSVEGLDDGSAFDAHVPNKRHRARRMKSMVVTAKERGLGAREERRRRKTPDDPPKTGNRRAMAKSMACIEENEGLIAGMDDSGRRGFQRSKTTIEDKDDGPSRRAFRKSKTTIEDGPSEGRRAAKKYSQSVMVGKTDVGSMESELAKAGRGARAKSMVVGGGLRRSTVDDVRGLRRSARRGDEAGAHGHRKSRRGSDGSSRSSSSLKGSGSSMRGLLQSATRHGSGTGLKGSRSSMGSIRDSAASSLKGSGSSMRGLLKSATRHGSGSSLKGSGSSMGGLRKSAARHGSGTDLKGSGSSMGGLHKSTARHGSGTELKGSGSGKHGLRRSTIDDVGGGARKSGAHGLSKSVAYHKSSSMPVREARARSGASSVVSTFSDLIPGADSGPEAAGVGRRNRGGRSEARGTGKSMIV